MRITILATAVLAGTVVAVAAVQQETAIDAAVRAFQEADSAGEAAQASRRILASGADVDQIVARLRAGRTYSSKPAGRVTLRTVVEGFDLDNVLEVPEGYTPSRAWPLRVSLHGGVGREAPRTGDAPARPLTNRIPSAGELVLHPRAWNTIEWWRGPQVDNVFRLIDRVKRDYNVDESRVYVTGISDGGTGVYYLGMRAATLWSACIPLNGHPSVLANPDTGADGQLYLLNLVNCPLHMVNGGKDPLYPAESVKPIVDMMRDGGITLDWQVYPDAGHDVSWWPQERPRFEAFLAVHPRQAHPARITWETERTDRYNRYRWLVIDRLGTRPSDASLGDDVNTLSGRGLRRAYYTRARPSGRVDIARQGNAFDAKTRGVQQFTLLLSRDAIDFSKPVRVTVNGRVVHDGVVRQDAQTLLEWAARDRDRTMLYTAALHVTVP